MSAATLSLDRNHVERLVRTALERQFGPADKLNGKPHRPKLVANISARHCHVTPEDLEKLFGPGHQLKPMRYLYQDGEFGAEEVLTVIGPRQRMIPGVRILGPC